jgi:hypothetical protein
MSRPVVIGAAIGLLLLSCFFAWLILHAPKPSLASLSVGTAPWATETEHLKERLAADNLPALSEEGTALHTHEHLDLMIHGTAVPVPSGIGIHESAPGFIAPIHTHDATGIIHVESPIVATFTLGQFFDIWGVRLTSACLGSYCTDEQNALEFYINGTRYQGDPREIPLTAHEEIAVIYGTASEHPTSTPSTYSFPEGL